MPQGSPKKTAVIVVHGMGEQRPMETLWGVVEALWTRDPDIKAHTNEVWSKPEYVTGSYELRRVTTAEATLGDGERRVDFFEFYWAHLMTGNTIRSVTSWLWSLLFRSPASVPPRLIGPWLSGLAAYIVFALALIYIPLHKAHQLPAWLDKPLLVSIAGVIAAIWGVISTGWLAPVAGDAARYLSATPDNVAARQKIREAGVDLLTRLHATGSYDRIVVLGHSLGSVIAYDMLNFAWGRLDSRALRERHKAGTPLMQALDALEMAAGPLVNAKTPGDIEAGRRAYRTAQRIYQAELAKASEPLWLVSDLVTVGSPLSKADVLLAATAVDLERKKALREVPCNPPWLEANDPAKPRYRLSYPMANQGRIPHHGAVFAPVVWTNVWFPSVLLGFGDLISGPCEDQLGRGVQDVRIAIGAPRFRHCDYWRDPAGKPTPPWITALRKAVNLRREPDAGLWGQATSVPKTPDKA